MNILEAVARKKVWLQRSSGGIISHSEVRYMYLSSREVKSEEMKQHHLLICGSSFLTTKPSKWP
jgi:hypothetical protein